MSEKKEKLLITDVFVIGARKGYNLAVMNVLPNVLMAFVIILILNKLGVLNFMGEYLGGVMSIFGLPGAALAVMLAAYLSWGGAAGVVAALFGAGILTVQDIAILVPGMSMVGSSVQYMGRILGVIEVPAKYYALMFLTITICAMLALWTTKLIIIGF